MVHDYTLLRNSDMLQLIGDVAKAKYTISRVRRFESSLKYFFNGPIH